MSASPPAFESPHLAIPPSQPINRLLVIADKRDLAGRCRELLPELRIVPVPTYLAGIAELSNGSVAGLLLAADRPANRLGPAVAGLREAAGPQVRIVLCCEPAFEPQARAALQMGADDYLIYPPEAGELGEALELSVRPGQLPAKGLIEPRPRLPVAELAALMEAVEGPREALLAKMAELVQRWLGAVGATVTCGHVRATAGVPTEQPVLGEPLFAGAGEVGSVSVGPRLGGSYRQADSQTLQELSETFGRLLDLAERMAGWRRRATTDELTGLGNEAALRAALHEHVPRSQQRRSRVSLIWLQVGGLQSYGDRAGRQQAEKVVCELAKLLTRKTRSYDVCCRVGEDQFALLLADQEASRVRGSQHPSTGMEFLWRLRDAILEEDIQGLGRSAAGGLRLHAALATCPWDSRTPEGLLEKARQALGHAKRVDARCLALSGPRAGQLLFAATFPTSPADSSSVSVLPDEPKANPAE
jgi:diguanylate cyclase (GGDEF)-like protein